MINVLSHTTCHHRHHYHYIIDVCAQVIQSVSAKLLSVLCCGYHIVERSEYRYIHRFRVACAQRKRLVSL